MNQRLINTASYINRHIPDLKIKIIREADLALDGKRRNARICRKSADVEGKSNAAEGQGGCLCSKPNGTLENAYRGISADSGRPICR